jgi:hypothetical protein
MSFKQIPLNLPNWPGIEVVGFVYASNAHAELTQDMLEVRLPIGVNINVGWYPEGDVAGKYLVKIWGAIELRDSETHDPEAAVDIVEDYVKLFHGLVTDRAWEPLSEACTSESAKYWQDWNS